VLEFFLQAVRPLEQHSRHAQRSSSLHGVCSLHAAPVSMALHAGTTDLLGCI
jgi:hypothetical protein